MILRLIIALVGFALVAVTLGVVKAGQLSEMASMNQSMPLTAVTTAPAQQEEWHPRIRAIGSLAPVQGVMISAELEGTITSIQVENGAAVAKGDLLVEMDTMVEKAQLDAAKARADLAKVQADRAKELRTNNTISQSEYDTAAAQYAQNLADVAAIQAAVTKKTIRAPFAGRVGIRQVNLGQYVSRGTALIPLQKLDPVFVNFYLPQRHLPQLGIGQGVEVSIDAFPDQTFDAQISAINPVVDQNTRNVWIQATLPNPGEKLRAGMFAKLEVTLPESTPVVVVPSTAVSYASYGNSVYVIEKMKGPDGSEFLGARQQPVVLGAKRGDLVSVLEGLNGDEEVASSGVFKLRNGLPVQVNNEVTPSAKENPAPRNS